ncbi:MAG: HAD-IC family P-type ATPase [Armatimonadota bacterium]
MPASPLLEVAHAVPGRARLRWRGDGPPPPALLDRLAGHEGVSGVEARSSGSIVLQTRPGLVRGDLERLAREWSVGPEDETREEQPVEVAHCAIPGRVRLQVPALRGKPRCAERLHAALLAVEGMRSAEASPLTGSVLVQFEPDSCSVPVVRERIAAFLQAEPERGPARLPRRAADARALVGWAAATPAPEVLRRLGVESADGLSEAEARKRLARRSGRPVRLDNRRSAAQILKEQLVTVPTGLLMLAMGFSTLTGARVDAVAIGTVLGLNGAIGYLTERYAERCIEALRRLGYPQAHVIRAGQRGTVPAAAVVPGDVVRLRAGDIVPAEARMLQGSLLVNEAMLTGEAEAVAKTPEPGSRSMSLHRQRSLLFHGTAVMDGRARAVVLATGSDTELGRIQELVGQAETPRTGLQEELDRLGKSLGVGAGSACAGLFGVGLLRRQPWLEMLQTTASLAVSAVPEGLPAVATTGLAVGMQRMLGHNVIIRRLSAVEALGSVTILCVDKTGTLTLNRMTASRYWWEGRSFEYVNGGEPGSGAFYLGQEPIPEGRYPALRAMLRVGALCNEAKLRRTGGGVQISGSPTEGALLLAARAGGQEYEELRRRHPLLRLHRRAEHHLRMASVHRHPDGGLEIAAKGAPEAVLELCTRRLDERGEAVPLTEADRRRYRAENERMAAEGYRVLAFAEGRKPDESLENGHLSGLTWLGLVGLEDPTRPGVAAAIRRCREAGVRTVILTGDQPGTALAVARRLGLAEEDDGCVLEASDLEGMPPERIAAAVEGVSVFARVSPEHKLRIVQALQGAGHVVAMTGDGVNDGPALKAADIGVAMGEGSTDVARELADVVLTRNDFEALVAAVEQGRTLYLNLQRVLRFLLGSNLSELGVAAAALIAGLPFPFRPLQLLWLNLVTDVFPALALVLEPSDGEAMRRPPRKPGTPLLGRREWVRLGVDGGLMLLSTFGAYLWALRRHGPGATAAAVALTTLVVAQALYALACGGTPERARAGRHLTLLGTTAGTVALQVAVHQLGPLRRLLGVAPLALSDYAVVLAAAAPVSLAALARPERLSPRPRPARRTPGAPPGPRPDSA